MLAPHGDFNISHIAKKVSQSYLRVVLVIIHIPNTIPIVKKLLFGLPV